MLQQRDTRENLETQIEDIGLSQLGREGPESNHEVSQYKHLNLQILDEEQDEEIVA